MLVRLNECHTIKLILNTNKLMKSTKINDLITNPVIRSFH